VLVPFRRSLAPVIGALLCFAVPADAAEPPAPKPPKPPPVASVVVGPERAVSLTLSLPAGGNVVIRAGSSSRRVIARKDRLVLDGDTFDRGRDPRTQRLVMSRISGQTTIGLGPRTLISAGSRTVRIEGKATLTDRYTSSAQDPLDRLGQRAGMLHVARPRDVSYLGQGVDADLHFRELRNWSAAFLPGLLWQVAQARHSALHARWAYEEATDLAAAARFDDPDIGFVFWRAALLGHETGCVPEAAVPLSPEQCAFLTGLVNTAAIRLLARSTTNPAGLIPTTASESECSQCLPGELRVIVDQLHNLPSLIAAAQFIGTSALTTLADQHARWVAANLVRPDGAVYQDAFVSRATSALIRTDNFQGYSPTSVWSRGQAWAIDGFARAARQLDDPTLLDAARRTADWWLANAPANGGIPRYDFSAPPGSQPDSSALAIAGVGLRILAGECARTGACDPTPYGAAANAARTTLTKLIAKGPELGRLGAATYTAGGLTWDENAEVPWGSDFLAQLILAR
jgi:unsaturated chondroitin disaccharide hydrolase